MYSSSIHHDGIASHPLLPDFTPVQWDRFVPIIRWNMLFHCLEGQAY